MNKVKVGIVNVLKNNEDIPLAAVNGWEIQKYYIKFTTDVNTYTRMYLAK